MSNFDRRPFFQVRRDIRDIVSIPVMAWMAFTPARRTAAAYRPLTDIPLELAACGFKITTVSDGGRWHISASKEVVPGSLLELTADARSYAAALFQIAHDADRTISDLETKARRRWTDAQKEEAAA